jgi:hypothetical protein
MPDTTADNIVKQYILGYPVWVTAETQVFWHMELDNTSSLEKVGVLLCFVLIEGYRQDFNYDLIGFQIYLNIGKELVAKR